MTASVLSRTLLFAGSYIMAKHKTVVTLPRCLIEQESSQ
jgi:hypothetical protein